ncbi:MAG: hypothetical protein KIT43_12070 [Bauldia sp.]|nr:hypothetical protein [Bauldia sp.]MCW5719306.1 hypothetical protein [Bauldia sp.]
MSVFARVRKFYEDNLSVGDRLGESIYAVWMGVVSIGLINAEATITPDLIAEVVLIAFGVNLVWGVIDGVTVMLTNVIDRRQRDVLAWELRSGGNTAARAEAMANLDQTIAAVLPEEERRRIVDLVAKGPPGPDPRRHPARATRRDWGYAMSIVLIDVLLVVPLVLPLILVPDVDTAIFVSRIIAATTFAALGAAYARNLGRRPAVAALALGALGYTLFTLAYEAGW